MTRRVAIQRGGAILGGGMLTALGAKVTAAGTMGSFAPGKVWRDTGGKPIQAHGGSIIKVGDTFYWYGENKERSLAGSNIWHWGVRAYSSTNLRDWTDAGIIIPPTPDKPGTALHPSTSMDRPHVLFHEASKKFVCWLKIMERDGRQTRTILTADRITGPYTMVSTGAQLLGMNAGDFDLASSHEDGKAYIYFERVHSELICADLTPDYTNVSGYYSTHMPRGAPPRVREAPAYFFRGGKHYLITSGTTHYHPNPSEVAIADTFHGPWRTLGDLHPKDRSRTSYNSQISSVFKHPGKKDLYIALADRWIPNLPEIEGPAFANGDAYRRLESIVPKFNDPTSPPNKEDMDFLRKPLDNISTALSTYVWLPLRFEGERPFIDWRDEWSLDEFA